MLSSEAEAKGSFRAACEDVMRDPCSASKDTLRSQPRVRQVFQ